MTLDQFRSLVGRLAGAIPAEFFDGVIEVTVSPRTLPHPTRGDIWTLGECVPVWGQAGEDVQSRVVLYHGSFAALAHHDPAFDWLREARETLLHELRHHLEWRASTDRLEALDRAAEQNFARQDGHPFDPLFHLDGESPEPGVYQVDDDWFLDHVVATVPERLEFNWHGRLHDVRLPSALALPAFVIVDGLADPPPGEVVLVLRRKSSILNLVRGQEPSTYRALAEAQPGQAGDSAGGGAAG